MNESHEQTYIQAMTGSDKEYQQSEFISGYIFNSMCDPVHLEDLTALDRYIELCPPEETKFKEALQALKTVFEFIK